MSAAPSLLEVRSLTRRFGGLTAVNSVDLDLAEGEFLSVIGPNGAGKTTLFNLITGHDDPDGGTVKFSGRDITRLPPEWLATLGIARTFQHGRVFANLSVMDNVLVGAHVRFKAVRPAWPSPLSLLGPFAEVALALIRPSSVVTEEKRMREEALRILARFGDRLLPRLDHPTYSLSYANRRRVEIGRALALGPKLLLLDEPTAGMNQTETAEMQTLIGDLKKSGLTILLIEHKLDMVMQLSDRVIVMDNGSVIANGKPAEVRNNPAVIEAYLGHRRSDKSEASVPEAAE
ncbi:branched-chain amino acid transport system ATP-binding protein [Enhydrobacter aerosaccus]|uniref:Branched-chain amino acid transport system ATP-binding protein n=1 Tax=Enhydrobacter aerosaccus TaxID=225324 RepID=A0A1T4T6H6_9HYPH|nr:ABC transporter ATP-binding protein [Enhydrobacter aerosaccus]SKA35841.1 branched-chain amino acid transport system ATP-binding protein [Enhydrobacter aerosaccus]